MSPWTDPDPPHLYRDYVSTRLRAPARPPVRVAPTPTEWTAPVFGPGDVDPRESDLTAHGTGEPLGERIVVCGRVMDTAGHPLPGALVEVWQANAAGRYRHDADTHPAPLDPNFTGAGRCLTDAAGAYRFVTVKPGAYPWRNHPNAWRPAHIHFSLHGPSLTSRLVTQMYFPGDPLLALDPILASVPDEAARAALVARLDLDVTVPEWALGYRFDIVLRGRGATPATPG